MSSYITTYFRVLPEEVIDYIWSMNYGWAARVIQAKARCFIRNKVKGIIGMLKFAFYNAKLGTGMKTYHVFFRNRVLYKGDVLTTLSACKCCPRHQKNKPTTLKKWFEINKETTEIQWHQCKCSCRHYSRWICRSVD
jgi:hypothetical protein|tara:strand:+ start:173 stop:583 length:411 start_codon:yes stop_codon:yes gene_type:complete